MEDSLDALSRLIKKTYVQQSHDAIKSRENLIRHFLEQRRCPEDGWDSATIEMLLQRLSLMDSNNYLNVCGVGEREGRIFSDIVAKRHFHFGHGIGRSGDLNEVQPKAAGSSLVNILSNSLVLDLLRRCGVPNTKACLIVPVATGMSIVLCLLTLRLKRPTAKYVIWSRIDQKSCFKAIRTAGYEAVVIENNLVGDALVTDVEAIKAAVERIGSENIAAIITTTSSFAPKVPDDIEGVASLCQTYDVPHIVNNAYGVQSSKCLHLIERSSRVARIDVYVQSCDKNFLVPVGGSIIAGFSKEMICDISKNYPGRASGTPSLDVLITLLQLGLNGFKGLLKERKECFLYLKQKLGRLAEEFNEKLLDTKANSISCGMTLDNFNAAGHETEIGSMLFIRNVSGARVVTNASNSKIVAGHEFINWGSHSDQYPHSYLTAAAALGCSTEEIDVFVKRLKEVLVSYKKLKMH